MQDRCKRSCSLDSFHIIINTAHTFVKVQGLFGQLCQGPRYFWTVFTFIFHISHLYITINTTHTSVKVQGLFGQLCQGPRSFWTVST